MQSPSLYLDQSHSLENLIKDIKSDINPSIIHPCVASFLPPLSLHNIETLGFPEDTTSQPENNFFTDLYESNLLSSSKKISNDLQSPYLSNCNIDPFQNITQDQLNSQAGLTAVRVADEDIGEDNDDKRSLIDELLCLFTPSDQKISIQKNKNKQKQFNTSLASNNYEKEDFNERQTTNKIFTSQNEDQFIDQSISSTVTFTNNSEIIDNIELNDYASKRAQQFKKTMHGKKENLHDQRQNHKKSRIKQANVKRNKKQTLMMKKLRKQITNTISIIQKRAIRNQNEDYYEYCWVFGCISCWFSLKSITVLYDIWLCWANSFIHQKEPLSETIKGVDRFEELIESIQSEYEKDPREKIKDQLELQGYLYQTKAVFKEITLNKALQFNRRANKSNETKQESGAPSSKSNIPINPQRSVNKVSNNIVNVSLKSSKESHKKQQIHPY